jgi:alpha-1,3/alpha-1,6-mannosyltransferase
MTKRHVAFIHPDLGIGGAEMLVINLALALESVGYKVTLYTCFFDPNRCFEEAKTLNVQVRGNWFPRSIFGRCLALCAYIRMFLCSLSVMLFEKETIHYVVIDQVSFPIPLLRLKFSNVLFYCHHPDKCLSTNDKQNKFKKVYRFFLDLAEELTTGCAKTIVVNSKYTKQIFREEFPLLRKYFNQGDPEILYPVIKTSNFKKVTRGENGKTIEELL